MPLAVGALDAQGDDARGRPCRDVRDRAVRAGGHTDTGARGGRRWCPRRPCGRRALLRAGRRRGPRAAATATDTPTSGPPAGSPTAGGLLRRSAVVVRSAGRTGSVPLEGAGSRRHRRRFGPHRGRGRRGPRGRRRARHRAAPASPAGPRSGDLRGRRRVRPVPGAPVLAPGVVLAGHGVDSACRPRRARTTDCVSSTGEIPDVSTETVRDGAAAGATAGVVACRRGGAGRARPGSDPEGPGRGRRDPGRCGGDDGRPQRAAVARRCGRCEQPQRVLRAGRDRARPGIRRHRRAEGEQCGAQVTGHRRCPGERAAQAALRVDGVRADPAGDEVAVPGALPVQREPARGVVRHLVAEAPHPQSVGHTVPAAGRRTIRPRVVGAEVVAGWGARCASDSRSWARPRWIRERTVPSLMPSVAATSS